MWTTLFQQPVHEVVTELGILSTINKTKSSWPLRLLSVSEAIHEAWKKGGESRASLLQKLKEANYDKASGWVAFGGLDPRPKFQFPFLPSKLPIIGILSHKFPQPLSPLPKITNSAVPGQDTFVKLVTMEEKKEEQVQMKCWAGWASEDKMRDTLKIKELGSQLGWV